MEKIIESGDNKKYKLAKKLKQKKYRDRFDSYLIEGINLLEEAKKVNAPIEVIFICEDSKNYELERNTFFLSKKLFNELSDTESSQGVIAVVKKNKLSLKDISLNNEDNVLILDCLQDLGNIGTIIRTAVATGYKAIFTLKGTGDIYSPKTVRSTAGLINRIPIIEIEDELELIQSLKEIGIKIVTTLPRGTKPYYETELKNGIALVVGNEGNGVRDVIIEKSDLSISIPMMNDVESLNAAVASSIIMYEAVRNN